ncbi:MAG: HAD family phosphatase [Clostridia bacterium]|nr:HAD family phosphatase [Clostridia bacterium]
MQFKYAVFDMDGTLLDTMDYWRDIVTCYAEMHGLPKPIISDNDAIAASHLSTYKKIAFLKERYNDQEAVKKIQNSDVYDIIGYFYKKSSKIRPGVTEMLESLTAHGVRMCVASATPSYLIEIALKESGLDKYFEFTLSPSEYPRGKAHPEIFHAIANRFGCEVNDMALFEDALYSIRTAHSLGMYIVAVREKYSEYLADEIKTLANEYLNEFTEYKYE